MFINPENSFNAQLFDIKYSNLLLQPMPRLTLTKRLPSTQLRLNRSSLSLLDTEGTDEKHSGRNVRQSGLPRPKEASIIIPTYFSVASAYFSRRKQTNPLLAFFFFTPPPLIFWRADVSNSGRRTCGREARDRGNRSAGPCTPSK